MKVIFLDIDGVLNDNTFDDVARSSSLDRAMVARLCHVLGSTGAKLVVSSSWRYLILSGAMSLRGFEYLLRTHGLPDGCLVGHTCADEALPGRGAQIGRYLAEHPAITAWLALDDDVLELGREAFRHVRCARGVGLTDADAARAIAVLGAPI